MKRIGLLLIAILQLAAVTWMIASREIVLATGQEVKFVTSPVDPADPFRGRYVALRFEAAVVESETDLAPASGPICAVLSVDNDGYATITALLADPPADAPYITITRWYRTWDNPVPAEVTDETANDVPQTYHYALTLPFDRYYMNEKAAPQAETAYREALANRTQTAADPKGNYLAVCVRNGKAVARQLYIDGQPVEEMLRAKSQAETAD